MKTSRQRAVFAEFIFQDLLRYVWTIWKKKRMILLRHLGAFGLPIGDSYVRDKMQKIINELGVLEVVFYRIRHISVT